MRQVPHITIQASHAFDVVIGWPVFMYLLELSSFGVLRWRPLNEHQWGGVSATHSVILKVSCRVV